jgi:DNA polymerase-4
MERKILHIDVNSAFLSWTAVDMLKRGERLDIRTIPAVIGGDEATRRGIVLARSVKAKELGIKTGEPLFSARQRFPNLKVYPTNFNVYQDYSDKMYNILTEYSDKIERYSIDECFLDMSCILIKETLLDKAKEISNRIKKELGFTVNIGLSTNKALAKMASDFEKPDKIHTLYPNEITRKMWPLPIGELFMVGRKSLPKLQSLGINTIGDLAKKDESYIAKRFGKHGIMLWEYANGIDESEVESKYVTPKGVGNSITFPYDIIDINKLNEILLSLTEQVAYRLRKEKLLAQVVSVQIKTKDFVVYNHQKKLDTATDCTKDIYRAAKDLLKKLHNNQYLRLIGIRVDSLCSKDEMQMCLFDIGKNDKQEKIDKAVDRIKDKFGYESVTRASKIDVNKLFNK